MNEGGGSPLTQAMFLNVAKVLSKTAFSRKMTRSLGECAEFAEWQVRRIAPNPRIVTRREEIWARMVSELRTSDALITVFEFGVAWGYTTAWFLKQLRTKELVWHGFDRFTGLPRAWRNHPVGAYNAEGRTPDIKDSRVRWHVGDVEDTLPKLNLDRRPGERWLILFDLDIYEPTSVAWHRLSPHLKDGDLVYFDEAMDADERRLLDEILDAGATKFEHVAANPISLALRIRRAQ